MRLIQGHCNYNQEKMNWELKLKTWLLESVSIVVGGIQQLRGPNLNQFWPPSLLEWTIMDILYTIYPLSHDPPWTFYWPPPGPPPLLVHVVIEWPLQLRKNLIILSFPTTLSFAAQNCRTLDDFQGCIFHKSCSKTSFKKCKPKRFFQQNFEKSHFVNFGPIKCQDSLMSIPIHF